MKTHKPKAPTTRTLFCGGVVITYQLTLTRRKTLAIRVHPDTRVSVVAPINSNLAEIEAFLHKRSAWILRHQHNFALKAAATPPRQYISGEIQHFIGEEYCLNLVQIDKGRESVRIDHDTLTICVRGNPDAQHIRKLIDAWYQQQALILFPERVAIWYPQFADLGAAPPQVAVRSMRSRWGSCTINGKITFTTRLVSAPLSLIDYVVVHELCHLKVRNHGPGFYQLLSSLMPDWKERKKQLMAIQQ